jgi:xyloglucan-specific exo-beta-1,4-glucanase
VLKSADNGLTWSQWFDKEMRNLSYRLFFDPHDRKTAFVLADQLYIGAASGDLYRTTDDGKSWTRLEVDTSRNVPLDGVTMLPTRPVTFFVVTADFERAWHSQLWRSADAGDTWVRAEGLPSRAPVTNIVAMPDDPRVLFAGTRGRGVFRSEDGGATWQPTAVR